MMSAAEGIPVKKEHHPQSRPRHPARLTVAGVLRLADAHHARTGDWPRITSGPVEGLPGVSWRQVDMALRRGRGGLPGGSSLPRLLAERRGARPRLRPPPLAEPAVVAWARAH